MVVNVSNLKSELAHFNDLLNTYEDEFLNLYNELSYSSSFWNDGHSKLFYNDVAYDKTKVETTIKEIEAIRDVYSYICENYGSLGKKVSFNLNARDQIIEKFNNYIKILDEAISMYDALDVSFCPDIGAKTSNQKSNLRSIKNQANTVKETHKQTFNKISETETQASTMLSRINVTVFKEKEIDQYI